MDIKEIALKVAKQMRESVYPSPYISESAAVEFAQALVAEIQQQGEPVAFAHAEFSWKPRQSECMQKLSQKAQPEYGFTKALFTFPPSIEALENRVAEACAALCCSYFYHYDETAEDCFDTPQEAAKAIRSGEWRKFLKGE